MILQPRAQVVEAGVPGGVLQPAVDSHLRPFETVGVVVHLRQRTTLRAGVALRERVVVVAADADHLVAVDVDEDAADRGADAAEASHRAHAVGSQERSPRDAHDRNDRSPAHVNVVIDNNAVNDNILDIVLDMVDRRYHHGDLRAALLAQAEATLRVSGVDGLSLRELARAVGVSHGAPRRHFEDKAALLEALVAEGFHRLGAALAAAAEPDGRGFVGDAQRRRGRLRPVRNRQSGVGRPDVGQPVSRRRFGALVSAREASFAPVRRLVEMGQSTGELGVGDVRRIGTLMFATLHGIATMANNKMIDAFDDQLIFDAVDVLLTGLAPSPVLRA